MTSGIENFVSVLQARHGPAIVTLSDREIIDRVLNGDKHLFELLMRRYNRRMFRLARSIVRDSSEAEDVLQESYLLAYANLDTFKGMCGAGGWLAKITMNEALGRLRRRHSVYSLDREIGFLDGEAALRKISAEMRSPEQFTNSCETMRLIESAIDHLPENYRSVFMLRAVEQMSVEETAEYLDIKPATVKTRFHRAKSILQQRLHHEIETLAGDAFAFAGSRCDRIVETVYRRLAGSRQ